MQKGFFAYWRCVRKRAAADTKAALGSNPVKSIMGLVTTTIAAFVFACLGHDFWEKVVWALLITFAGILPYLTVFFVYFVRTPWKMENEVVTDANNRHQELIAKFDNFERSLDSTRTRHASEVAVLQSKLDEKPAAAADVGELFNELVRKASAALPTYYADCEAWTVLCEEVTRTCLGWHERLNFVRPENVLNSPERAKQWLEQCKDKLGKRVQSLREGKPSLLSTCTVSVLTELRSKVDALPVPGQK